MTGMEQLYNYFKNNHGAQIRLSEYLGLSRAAVNRWKLNGRVPAEHVLGIEKFTGISRHILRPDVFGDQPQ